VGQVGRHGIRNGSGIRCYGVMEVEYVRSIDKYCNGSEMGGGISEKIMEADVSLGSVGQ
jgi:hypothetical protein